MIVLLGMLAGFVRHCPSAGCSALRASQPANAAVNPVSKLKFAAGLAADPQRLGSKVI
jgi:hypothetical protein